MATKDDSNGGSPTEALTGNPLLTIVILVGGVAGGLALVIGVIFFCKYCVKKSRDRDRTAFFSPLPVELDVDRHPRPTLLQFKPHQEDAIAVSHKDNGSPESKLLDQTNEDGEPLTDDDSEPDRLPDIPEEEPQGPTDPDDILQYIDEMKKAEMEKQEKQAAAAEAEPSPKKVSFQVCQPYRQKRAEYTRRYTEGDFHHLKSSRIKHPPECTKSMSLDYGTAMMSADRSQNVQPMKPLLQPQPANIDTSPSPTDVPSYTAHTIKAQIHNQPNGAATAVSEAKSMDMPKSPAKMTGPDTNGRRAPAGGHARSPRRTRKEMKDTRSAPPVAPATAVASGFVPIPSDNETGFAEPISSDGSDGKPNEIAISRVVRPTEILNGPTKVTKEQGKEKRARDYHDLWHLRTTLEMEDTASSTGSSEPDTVVPANGSKDNLGPTQAQVNQQEPEIPRLDVRDTETGTQTWPLEEETEDEKHRLCVIQRHKLHARGDQPDSFEQIFSSISTEESDTSERSKGGDSSGKDSASKLRQMQADSGYTSIEHKNELSDQQKRQLLFTTSDRDSTSIESMYTPILSSETSPIGDRPTSSETDGTAGDSIDTIKDEPGNLFGRKRSDRKTASTKRREFTKGKGEAIFGSFSFPEEDSEHGSVTSEKSVYMASDSQGESPERRRPRMGRLFRLSREERLNVYPKGRDYSIDEKTDVLFKEFLRQDAMFETSQRRARPTRGRRLSLHHKQHSDSFVESSSKIMEVPLEQARSASFDTRGETAKERLTHLLPASASSSRSRITPQDSIEEEYLRIESSKMWDGHPPPSTRETDNNLNVPHENTLSVPHDPVLKESSKRGPPVRSQSAAAAPGYGPSEGPVHLGLEDVSSRRSAFRAVRKSPLLKRSYALEDGSSVGGDPPEATTHTEPSRVAAQPPAVASTSPGSKSPKSPRSPKVRPRQPSRSMALTTHASLTATVTTRSPHPEASPRSGRRSKSPLRHQSTGSSQGSVEIAEALESQRAFHLAVPGTPPDRPHSASSVHRLQQEARAPPFNRRHSDEAFEANESKRSYDHSRSPRPHRAHARLQGRPPTNRTSSENNIFDRQNKSGSERDLRRQQYGRAHSALDVFAAQKPYREARDRDSRDRDSRDRDGRDRDVRDRDGRDREGRERDTRDLREQKARRTPDRDRERERYFARSQTFDCPISPSRERPPRDRRYAGSPDRDRPLPPRERRHPESPDRDRQRPATFIRKS
ncbi:uncharacterized protein [Amphiura filiformis]|uniref:uncharacterized protein n=1 Tax=Amphiura filiformis TaxID=82378 RepID=UPI003B21AEEA